MFIILTLIIIVATFNIISGLTILVKNKSKEIAILKTLGFSNFSISKIFLITGSSIGILGTGFGVLLGVLVSYYIENIRLFLSDVLNIEIFLQKFIFEQDANELRFQNHFINKHIFNINISDRFFNTCNKSIKS